MIGLKCDERPGARKTMHIITRKRLNEFAARHPTAASGLAHWYRALKRNHFASFVELRRAFPQADQVGGLTVFNIGGNKARLIAAMHYNRRKVYIRAVLTHAEYDAGKWKEK
jgi:mRNA interferase HigB